jgi:hypothetical protein
MTAVVTVPIFDIAFVPGHAVFLGGWVENNNVPVAVFAAAYGGPLLPEQRVQATPLVMNESLTVGSVLGIVGQWLIHT